MTAATVVANDGWLIGGVDALGHGQVRRIGRIDGEWVPAALIATGDAFPVSLALAHGRLAALMSDGRVIATPSLDATDLPQWSDAEVVGDAPSGLRLGQLTSVLVASADRVELHIAMGGAVAWDRSANGAWTKVADPEASRPRIEVERPVRIGAPVRVGLSLVQGPLVCEYGASGAMVPIEPSLVTESHVVLPDAWTAGLQADQRYRLRSFNAVSGWFYPAAITGQAWGSNGVGVQECRVYEAGARVERGRIPFRTSVIMGDDYPADRVKIVAIAATGASSLPPVEERGGQRWLVPERGAVVETVRMPGTKVRAVVAPVPLPRQQGTVGSWVHFQFVVLGADGSTLGATGIRSIAVLPDAGKFDNDYEVRSRLMAESFWTAHAVPEFEAFWHNVTSN